MLLNRFRPLGISLDDLIINLCVTGLVHTKADNPHLPIHPDEIIADVLNCCDLGVSIVHLHARDVSGTPTADMATYKYLIESIREQSDVIICVSTSGRIPGIDFTQRARVLELHPDMASLSLGSVDFHLKGHSVINNDATIKKLLQKMDQHGVKPEFEIFHSGMIAYLKFLLKKGHINPPDKLYCNLLLGNLGTAPFDPNLVQLLLAQLPPQSIWSIGGIGQFQERACNYAIAQNGHVRMGLEDNIWLDRDKNILATNEALIKRVIHAARAAGRNIASPRHVRSLLGLE